VNFVLHVRINGRERFTAPYDPATKLETARFIDGNMPALSREGRVVWFVQHGNVAHLITGSRKAT